MSSILRDYGRPEGIGGAPAYPRPPGYGGVPSYTRPPSYGGPTLRPTGRTSINVRDLPEFAPDTSAFDIILNREKYTNDYVANLMKLGLDEGVAYSAAEVAFQRRLQGIKRPKTPLDIINTVATAPGAAIAGFVSGAVKSIAGDVERNTNVWKPAGQSKYPGSHIASAGGLGAINPWDAVIEGGKEAGTAVREHKMAGDYLAPDNGLLGFALSTVFDPVMYISGGATAGSKLAAMSIIKVTTREAQRRAANILAKEGPEKGMYFGQRYDDVIELTQAIRQNDGMPMTMGQALDVYHGYGLEAKSALRQLKPYEKYNWKTGELEQKSINLLKPTDALRVAGAYVFPTAVRGGRGMRFAGMQIPGTARLGEMGAQRMRADLTSQILRSKAPEGAKAMGLGFATNPELRLLGDDTIRALALGAMADFKARLQGAKIEAVKGTRAAARVEDGANEGLRYASMEERDQAHIEPPLLPRYGYNERSFGGVVSGDFPEEAIAEGVNKYGMPVRAGYEWPTPEELQSLPFLSSFPFLIDKKTGQVHIGNIWAGTHADAFENWMIEHNRDWTEFHEGRGIFDPDHYKKIGAVNIGVDLTRDEIDEIMAKGLDYPWLADKDPTLQRAYERRVRKQAAKVFDDAEALRGGRQATPIKQKIYDDVKHRVAEEIDAGKAVGLPEKETTKLWEKIQAMTDDPIEALGMFWFQSQIRVRSRQFIDEMLHDPFFAIPVGKDAEIPIGYLPMTSPVDHHRYAVLGDMFHALNDLMNPQYLDRSTDAVRNFLSMPQNWWKQFATSANPSFHVMNFLGAIWNNLYAGIYNPNDYLQAVSVLYKARMEEAYRSGKARYMGRKTFTSPTNQRARDIMDEATVRGASSETASIYAEITEGLNARRPGREFVPAGAANWKEIARDVALPRRDEKLRRYGTRQLRRGTALGMIGTGNPIGVALLAPEAAAVGKIAGQTIEDVVRLAPFMKAAHDPVLARTMEAFGPIRIPGMTHPGFSKEVQKAQYDIGAAISKHFQFDYADLTDFERRWAKLVFPFYVFYKKNFLLQAQLLAQAPRGVHAAQATMNYLNENSDVNPAMQQLLPEYFSQLSAFQVPMPQSMRRRLGLPLDQPLFLNPKLPFVSLNLMPALWNVWGNTNQPTSQKVLGVFAPMLGSVGPLSPVTVPGIPGMKILLEAMVGESLGLNKTLDYQRSSSNDYRNSWVPAPNWVQHLPKAARAFFGIFPYGKTHTDAQGNILMTATGAYIMNQMATPFVTNLGQIIPTGGQDQGKSKADMISWLTGIRLIPWDSLRAHRSWAYRMKSMLEARKSDLKAQGLELDPTDEETLLIVREQLKVLEDAWDIRQQELYPQGGG